MAKRLPIIGDPPPPKEDRPICVGCGCTRTPWFTWEWPRSEDGTSYVGNPTGRLWNGHYEGYGNFHSMRCAVKWANTLLNVPRDRAQLIKLIKDGRG